MQVHNGSRQVQCEESLLGKECERADKPGFEGQKVKQTGSLIKRKTYI